MCPVLDAVSPWQEMKITWSVCSEGRQGNFIQAKNRNGDMVNV